MIRNHKILGMFLVCLILASACNGAAVDETSSESETGNDLIETSQDSAEPTPSDYWNGGDYPHRPVYSLTFGISQAAHDAFSTCGLPDNAIETAVESYLPSGTERQMIVAQDSQKEPLWSVSLTVKLLTADIYEVTCERVEP